MVEEDRPNMTKHDQTWLRRLKTINDLKQNEENHPKYDLKQSMHQHSYMVEEDHPNMTSDRAHVSIAICDCMVEDHLNMTSEHLSA